MAKLRGDRVANEDFQGHEEEEFGTGGHSLGCFGLLCPLGMPERVGYRSLPHGDCTEDKKCWEGGGQRAKDLLLLLLLESMARMRWRSLGNKSGGDHGLPWAAAQTEVHLRMRGCSVFYPPLDVISTAIISVPDPQFHSGFASPPAPLLSAFVRSTCISYYQITPQVESLTPSLAPR
ncbi:hypothetical protein GW17_00024630 [Ensete ventricosum]|nr:hypothetical protein GW17_00024630 [Ensete ventricosum]